MRSLFLYSIPLALLILFAGCSGNAQPQKTVTANGAARIEVLDFHTTHRCKTCLTIEQLTKGLLAESCSREMKEGLISFRLINADDEANEAIVEKHLAFGTTLIINTVNEGQESHIDLTSFAFMNAGDEAKFKAGLKKHLDASLQKIKV